MTCLQNLAQPEAKSHRAGLGAQPKAALQQSWQLPRFLLSRHCVGKSESGLMLEALLARPATAASWSAFPEVTAPPGFSVETLRPRSARIRAAVPSVNLAFASSIFTPSDLSDWMASLGVLTGWPIAFVTFTAKSPTVTVDFWALLAAANAATVTTAVTVRTSKDFLIIMWAPPSDGYGVDSLLYHSRHAWPSMNAESAKAPRNLRLNNSDVKQVFRVAHSPTTRCAGGPCLYAAGLFSSARRKRSVNARRRWRIRGSARSRSAC